MDEEGHRIFVRAGVAEETAHVAGELASLRVGEAARTATLKRLSELRSTLAAAAARERMQSHAREHHPIQHDMDRGGPTLGR